MKNKAVMFAVAMALTTGTAVTGVAPLAPVLTVSAAEESVKTVATTKGVANFGRGTASIVIKGNAGQTLAGKKFNVYKLFDAVNAKKGESINYTFNPAYKTALQNVIGPKLNKKPADVTEYEVIDYIQSLNNNKVDGAQTPQNLEGRYSSMRYFVEELRDEMARLGNASDVVTVADTRADNSIEIAGLSYGYYITDEVTAVEGTHSAASLCMVNTANSKATVNIKSDYPSVIKKIREDDNRDKISSNTWNQPGNTGWNDIADFEIGQTVPYKFESNVPDMNGYNTYYYAWQDVMDDALTFHKDSVKIYIKSGTKTYEVKESERTIVEQAINFEDAVPEGYHPFKVVIPDLKKIIDREFNQMDAKKHNVYGQKIIVAFNATLNDKAADKTGRPGFENNVRLEFSNNPDSNGSGDHGNTPWDTVVCFTYKLNGLKVNEYDVKLEGAKFRLYSDKECKNEVYLKKTANGYNVINRDSNGGYDHTGGVKPAEAVEMVTGADGVFTIFGLDGGTYYLKETEAPAGYRLIEDAIVVNVKPAYVTDRDSYIKGDGATNKALQTLNFSADIKTFYDGKFTESTDKLTVDIDDGSANLKVVNQTGKKLPITGSNATVILLSAGTVLMTAGVLAGKKRKKEQDAE